MNTSIEQQRLAEFTHLLKTKARTPADTNGAYTVKELEVATGCGGNWVRASLRVALATGAWEVVRVQRMNITGRSQVTPGYRPVPNKKKK